MSRLESAQHLGPDKIYPKKSLGQNFLVDKTVLSKIIEAAEIDKNDIILEIGPGTGVLTQALLDTAGKVIAIEKDEKLARQLQRKVNSEKLMVIEGDILDFDPKKLMSNSYKLVANIPYYITAKILNMFLTAENKPELIVLMVQKEVAERVCAKPGEMSLLSLSVQLFGEPEICGIVKKTAFRPVPKVDSAILKIQTFKGEKRPQNISTESTQKEKIFKFARMGFASRRKTLLNNLAGGIGIPKEKVLPILQKSGLTEMSRAQELNLEQWGKLSQQLEVTTRIDTD